MSLYFHVKAQLFVLALKAFFASLFVVSRNVGYRYCCRLKCIEKTVYNTDQFIVVCSIWKISDVKAVANYCGKAKSYLRITIVDTSMCYELYSLR